MNIHEYEIVALALNRLERLAAGRTTFIIAHRLSTVRDADVIVVLRDGVIVERGPFAELIRDNGPFASLYRTQFEVPLQESRRLSG